MSGHRRLTTAEKEAAERWLRAGHPVAVVARNLRATPPTIWRIAALAGVVPVRGKSGPRKHGPRRLSGAPLGRPAGPTRAMSARDLEWARRYKSGESMQQIATDYGISRERVRQRLAVLGAARVGAVRCLWQEEECALRDLRSVRQGRQAH